MDRTRHDELKVSLWLPRALWKRAKLLAAAEGRSLRLLLVEALGHYLDRKGG
jgi:hypothetical protein